MRFRTIEQIQADIHRRLNALTDESEIARLERLLTLIDSALNDCDIHALKIIILKYNQ